MPYEKRKLKRIDIFLIAEFKELKKAAVHSVGITRNLSCEGFSLESQSFGFGRGEILEFRLKHPQGDLSVTVLGEVVWKKQGWYKYAAGIMFHEINEETKSEISRLMSALDDMPPDEPAPDSKESAAEATESNEEEIMPDQVSDFRDTEIKKDKVSQPDTVQAAPDDIAAPGKDREKKRRRYIPIAAILFIIFVVTFIVIINMYNKGLKSFNPAVTESVTNKDIERKQTMSADDGQTGGQTFEEPFEQLQEQPDQEKESVLTEKEETVNPEQSSAKQDTTGDMTSDPPFKPDLKSEGILRSLPAVEIKEIKKPEPDPKKEKILKARPAVKAEKSSWNEIIKKIARPQKTGPAAKAEKTAKAKVSVKSKKVVKIEAAVKSEKPSKAETALKSEETLKSEVPPKAEVIAKPEELLKTEPVEKVEKREKPEKTGPVVKPPKFPNIALIVKRKKPQKIKDGSITQKSSVAAAVLSERWEKIGSTKKRIPLFIDTETISYPSEHIVKFSMKALINKKEFIDLLEIDCSQNKLRIVKERPDSPPILSPYSTEWRDIIPGSRLLYEAVCSRRNRS
ncbi:PilZ domain protein [bacterium BMS3Abin06]|nr:PilZ domain protein [bacterium BMS3Abin06]